ncbi:hypothetical protein MUS1_08765 [Marinomonas ushuaiensis DSM 15871]|uniref:Uncharacterized protein n=1 Tax=Marinomonas ushuaiensis DSM 15871 TaxID=1122207 RepID=X7E2R4_9GAMM|nr:hypothetical protein MUS1_08765 [Marinomonas ushuaiensis DSM 15871]
MTPPHLRNSNHSSVIQKQRKQIDKSVDFHIKAIKQTE